MLFVSECVVKHVNFVAHSKKKSYLCAMYRWLRRKRRIRRLCLEHARRHGMEREYRIALAHLCSPIEALQEWDIYDEEIQMKIQAEYNSLIDIELPPPQKGASTVISIDSIGVTIRISERPAAPQPQRRPQSRGFQKFIIDPSTAGETLARLHAIIDGKPPKTCALAVLAAMRAGLVMQPSYAPLRAEFPEIGAKTNYYYYMQRAENYAADIAAIKLCL